MPDTARPDFSVTTGPITGSKKIYITSDRAPEIRVPMRQIDLHPTANEDPVKVYDTSVPIATRTLILTSIRVWHRCGAIGSWRAAM